MFTKNIKSKDVIATNLVNLILRVHDKQANIEYKCVPLKKVVQDRIFTQSGIVTVDLDPYPYFYPSFIKRGRQESIFT